MLLGSVGSWMYSRSTLGWLANPELAGQLPPAYRWFARYCSAWRGDPPGAEALLRAILALGRRRAPGGGIVPLRLATGETLFLDLYDPRFLRIPAELPGVAALLRRFLREGDTLLDVGANQGAFSVAAAGLVGAGGLVIAIEPQPRLASAVRQSLESGPAPFEVHPLACGDRTGEVDFHVPSSSSGLGSLFREFSGVSAHRSFSVPLRRLDDLLEGRALPGRLFVKLDIEGGELGFLRGARHTLRSAPPMLLEVNPRAMLAAGTSHESLLGALLGLGYRRFAPESDPDRTRPLQGPLPEGNLIVLA